MLYAVKDKKGKERTFIKYGLYNARAVLRSQANYNLREQKRRNMKKDAV
jgi:hypothetical protein